MKTNCLEKNCNRCCTASVSDSAITPFDSDDEELLQLFSYFLHKAPEIDSALSKKIPASYHNEIFERMMEGRHFKAISFCSSNVKIDSQLAKVSLYENDLCPKCKRFVCKYKAIQKKEQSESNLHCFLRHIRNSIAHAHVYMLCINNRKYILFEDYNKSKNRSARIICVKADLKYWKRILCDKRYSI